MSVEVAQARIRRLVDSGLLGSCRPKDRLLQLANQVKTIDEASLRKLEYVFSALGDLTRLKILNLITNEGELCSCEIMAALELTQPTTSHHLGILERAGVISSRREGKWVFYRLASPNTKALLTKGVALVKGVS
jgi:ArsR family transcriptional regulator